MQGAFSQILGNISSIAMTMAVGVAAWQLWLSRIQARAEFEDQLSREYREIVRRIPAEALLGVELNEDQAREALSAFLSYFDLTNEQVFLRKQGRIRKETWRQWRDGIRSTLERPAFMGAWRDVQNRSAGSFSELRTLEALGFEIDPRKFPRDSPAARPS